MYSHDFTLQSGPISEVLANAKAPDGEDWALVWTVEDLVSDREEEVKDGWFSTVGPSDLRAGPVSGRGADTGATRTERMVILPERPYQALAELNPPGFRRCGNLWWGPAAGSFRPEGDKMTKCEFYRTEMITSTAPMPPFGPPMSRRRNARWRAIASMPPRSWTAPRP